MAVTVQFRRGTATQNDAFTGAAGEVSVNTTNNSIRVHDGSTQGGHELMLAGEYLVPHLMQTKFIIFFLNLRVSI